jgi:SAM-dependent methyltransferase
MSARDALRFVNDLDATTLRAVIDRLKFRGQDPTFCSLRDAYLARLPLAGSREVLDLGCGAGGVGRALARRDGFAGRVIGLDQSPALVEAGRRFAADGVWPSGSSSVPATRMSSTSRRIGSTVSTPTR